MACNVPLLEEEQIPELKCSRVVMQKREPAKLQATSCFSGRYLEHVAGKPASQISLVDNNRVIITLHEVIYQEHVLINCVLCRWNMWPQTMETF